VTVVGVRVRYLVAVGGNNREGEYTERCVRMDVRRLGEGWVVLDVVKELALSGSN